MRWRRRSTGGRASSRCVGAHAAAPFLPSNRPAIVPHHGTTAGQHASDSSDRRARPVWAGECERGERERKVGRTQLARPHRNVCERRARIRHPRGGHGTHLKDEEEATKTGCLLLDDTNSAGVIPT